MAPEEMSLAVTLCLQQPMNATITTSQFEKSQPKGDGREFTQTITNTSLSLHEGTGDLRYF